MGFIDWLTGKSNNDDRIMLKYQNALIKLKTLINDLDKSIAKLPVEISLNISIEQVENIRSKFPTDDLLNTLQLDLKEVKNLFYDNSITDANLNLLLGEISNNVNALHYLRDLLEDLSATLKRPDFDSTIMMTNFISTYNQGMKIARVLFNQVVLESGIKSLQQYIDKYKPKPKPKN